ncbi:16S rRNA processing protein RimM [Veillonella montpellierensis DNF00314]|uniref:Ribosome maturation factor RimM n=1 Tax=Veillonella montpellierensis DNF00314 TaxID=1401067 RepID=A0A096CSN2_9FIRM|nr:ribosome maturation factor RimM [Veillonella montpellierensis]KGF48304.1 16S rRNA processing protein RimM [Veillonella montpellierensis DNF00314]
MQHDLITIGVIVAPHGVRGELKVIPQTDFPDRFLTMDDCYIDGKLYHLSSARFHKQFVLITLDEIVDRNAAELISKKDIQITREQLVPLEEGRYYIFDMIGLSVYNKEGVLLGTVSDVLQPGANDVYVVTKPGEPDLLLAAIDGVIIDIDMNNRTMIVDPPEWI